MGWIRRGRFQLIRRAFSTLMDLLILDDEDSHKSQHMYVSGQLVFPDFGSLGNCVTPRAKKDAMNERGSLA
jgi:hypothetical protein